MLQVGIIGYGVRMRTFVGALLATGKVCVAAVADPDEASARAHAKENGVEDAVFYTDAKAMLENEALDGVAVGTRCPLHTEMAELVASYGLPLFLEKPVCISEEELPRLSALLPAMEKKTVVSFPLRASLMYRRVKALVDSGVLGEIAHVQAVNNVPYGRGYYHKWYRDESQTGGLSCKNPPTIWIISIIFCRTTSLYASWRQRAKWSFGEMSPQARNVPTVKRQQPALNRPKISKTFTPPFPQVNTAALLKTQAARTAAAVFWNTKAAYTWSTPRTLSSAAAQASAARGWWAFLVPWNLTGYRASLPYTTTLRTKRTYTTSTPSRRERISAATRCLPTALLP
ncbi:MAG: Gfo/Idh/MocA family oxidoreductase [Clostridia bacterium]|nr:Gfo/Idh/MocA family oxidoreductase [Clostridia bacterium]